jgi:chain length determinant protein EpsF
MNFLQYLLVLNARRRIALFILAVTVVTTTVVSLIIPKTYTANTTLLVDVKDEQTLANVLVPARAQAGYMQTQVEIITSQKVARKVVQTLKLADSPTARAGFQEETDGRGAIEDWLAENMLKRLKTDTSQSSTIQVIYSANDPKFAAIIANAFAKAYIETTLELRVEPTRQAAVWFDEQIKTLRANLEQAQAKLTAFQKEKGIVAADEKFDVESTRLSELSTQFNQAQNQTYDMLTRQRQGQQVLAKGISPEDLPEVLANPYIQAIKTDILRGDAKLKEIGTQLGVSHPQYQRQMSENQSLREKLEQEMKKVVSGLENSTRQNVQREGELRGAIASQRSRVMNLKQARDQIAVLMRDVETAQRAYDSAMQRSTVSKIDSRASQTNVAILNPAIEPLKPARPKLWLNITLSIIIGSMLGVGAALLLEFADRRVRSGNDLVGHLESPLLAQLTRRLPKPKDGLLSRLFGRAARLAQVEGLVR